MIFFEDFSVAAPDNWASITAWLRKVVRASRDGSSHNVNPLVLGWVRASSSKGNREARGGRLVVVVGVAIKISEVNIVGGDVQFGVEDTSFDLGSSLESINPVRGRCAKASDAFAADIFGRGIKVKTVGQKHSFTQNELAWILRIGTV